MVTCQGGGVYIENHLNQHMDNASQETLFIY